MKNLLFVLSLLTLLYGCECFKDLFSQKKDMFEECTIEIPNPKDSITYQIHQKCRQVVVDLSGPNADLKLQWLNANKFTKIETCSCNDKLQLWGTEAVELLTTDDPTASKGKVNGDDFSLNYVLEFDRLDSAFYQIKGDTINNYTYPTNPTNTVVIAFIDTGVDLDNATLEPFLWHNPQPGIGCVKGDVIGFNFADPASPLPKDSNRHGTFIAGVLAGKAKLSEPNHNIGTKLMPLKFTDGASSGGSLYTGVCAMYYAIQHGAKVINLSWGFEAPRPPAIMKPALATARKNNVLVVAAAGNSSADNDKKKYWPSGFAADPQYDVVSVAGMNTHRTGLGDYTNFGSNSVTLAAPGDRITSTQLGGGAIALTGTSAAAPFVSRTAALIMGLHPTKSAAAVKACLSSNTLEGGSLEPLPTTLWPRSSPPRPEKELVRSGGFWRPKVVEDCN